MNWCYVDEEGPLSILKIEAAQEKMFIVNLPISIFHCQKLFIVNFGESAEVRT